MGHFDLHRRFLNAMSQSSVTLIVIIPGTILHLPITWYVVQKCHLGIEGVAIANTITSAIILAA